VAETGRELVDKAEDALIVTRPWRKILKDHSQGMGV
jgi:hypothetical protein